MKLTKETLKAIIKEELQATLREGLDEHDIVLKSRATKNLKNRSWKWIKMKRLMIMDEYKTDRYTAISVLGEIGYFQDEDGTLLENK